MSISLPPPLPTLAAGEIATSANLNAMASTASFLGNRPLTRVVSTNTPSISTSNNVTAISWTSASYDNSGMYNSGTPGYLTVQVPGYYKLRYSIPVGNSGGVFNAYVSSVSNGVSSSNYLPSGAIAVSSVPAAAAGASGDWPFYLNQGDKIYLWITANTTGFSVATSPTTPSLALEFASQ